MKTTLLTVNGHDLFIARNDEKKQPVLGIHGLTGNYAHMLTLAKALGSDFSFTSYDVRGRGNSSPANNPSSLLQHAKDAKALLDFLDLQHVLVIGHSMGGYISAILAGLSDRVAGIVLLDGAGKVTQQECDMLAPALGRLDKIFPSAEAYIEGVRPNYEAMGLSWNLFLEQAVLHEIGPWPQEPGRFKYKGDSARIMEDLQSCVDYDHAQIFAKIKCPVMLAYASGNMGTGNPLYQEQAYTVIKDLIPNLTYFKSPANHYTLALENQPVLNEKIKEFAKKCSL